MSCSVSRQEAERWVEDPIEMHYEAQRLIEELSMQPHPEGGYFCEAYRSPISVETPRGKRLAITSIYYLLADSMLSAFHRLASDEIWHHYRGSPVAIEIIEPEGGYRQELIGGSDRRQAAVGAGAWFAAHLADLNGYAFLGCDVGPGFEYKDFEIGSRKELTAKFPQHRVLIDRWALLQD
jgi:predicted cupin superfamily sugar epimerase